MIDNENQAIAELIVDMFAMAAFKDGQISPMRVWDRVLSATMASAASTDTFGEFVEAVADRLQMASFFQYEAAQLYKLSVAVDGCWPDVRRLLETQPRFIVGMVRATRDENRAAKKEDKT